MAMIPKMTCNSCAHEFGQVGYIDSPWGSCPKCESKDILLEYLPISKETSTDESLRVG